MVDEDCYIQYAVLILVPRKYTVLCSFLSVAAQLRSLALHKHDEDFIFLPAYLIRLVEYQRASHALYSYARKPVESICVANQVLKVYTFLLTLC